MKKLVTAASGSSDSTSSTGSEMETSLSYNQNDKNLQEANSDDETKN